MAARHNFPITHHSWQRLSQQKARRPSIQSVQIDPLSVFACDCVKTKRRDSRAKRERAGIWKACDRMHKAGRMLRQFCVVLLCDSACEQTSVYLPCHVHPKRDMLELVGVREPSAEPSHGMLKLKGWLGAVVCVRLCLCVGCLKGHWLLQPPTDSSEPAKSTEMQQNLTDAPKYIIFPEKKNRFKQESDSYVDTINNNAQQVSEYTAACLQTLNIVCIMKREEMFSHTRMNKWTQVN